MELRGWDFTGRNIIASEKAMVVMIDYLSNPDNVKGKKWGNELQANIASILSVNTGSIRTLKVILEKLGFVNPAFFQGKLVDLLTERGTQFRKVVEIRDTAEKIGDNKTKVSCADLLKELYVAAIVRCVLPNGGHGNSASLHVFSELACTLRRHKYLDKVEWFLLNTIVTEDDNIPQRMKLDELINQYRKGEVEILLSDLEKIPKKLSVSYYINEFASLGLIKKENIFVEKEKSWKIYENEGRKDLYDVLISGGKE